MADVPIEIEIILQEQQKLRAALQESLQELPGRALLALARLRMLQSLQLKLDLLPQDQVQK